MMANFISSILWSLGVTCILVVPGFVEGGENIALNHLSYGMSKVMINEDGFYTTENYKTANASKLHTNFVRLTPNRPNSIGYFFGESKIGQSSVGGVLYFRILGNGGDVNKRGNGLWMFITKEHAIKLKPEKKGKMVFDGIAILINSRTPGKEAFEVFVNEINFDTLGTRKSSSIGGCTGTMWFDKLLDRTDFSMRKQLKFLIKDGKLSMDTAHDLFEDWHMCVKNLDLSKSISGDVLSESYVTFAATTDSTRMDIHDVMNFVILKKGDALFDHDNVSEELHSISHGYNMDDEESRIGLLEQFMDHELHIIEERMDAILDDMKKKEEHFENIMNVVLKTTTDKAGNALEERIAKAEKLLQDRIVEKKESLISMLEHPDMKENIKEHVTTTLTEHDLHPKKLHWLMPFTIVSVTICFVFVIVYKKYVPVLLMMLTAYPRAQTALAGTISNYF
eukprot:44636_1